MDLPIIYDAMHASSVLIFQLCLYYYLLFLSLNFILVLFSYSVISMLANIVTQTITVMQIFFTFVSETFSWLLWRFHLFSCWSLKSNITKIKCRAILLNNFPIIFSLSFLYHLKNIFILSLIKIYHSIFLQIHLKLEYWKKIKTWLMLKMA